ncbi:NAD(P)H-nitrite reductase large subunit [Nocardioides thalensis]|uniref:NAD(P)H-nitrite reductase large subunit n=1 Tax=Nocardioides thalensis TaxID=1914755 RepID=A0A853BWJ5_9ACTN|nr:NAD(P)H-nitrite reductase large subunit [Nocardioides thalensis]
MSRKRIVIVGSGMATTRLVEELVARGAHETHHITVLGDEAAAPYNRILLSAVLEGTHRPEAITLRGEEWYAEHGIDLRLGSRVLQIDRDHSDVMLVDGTLVEYDALVLATGSIPTLPPIRGLVRMDGSLHEAVHAFRSLADCERLLDAIDPSRWSSAGGEERAAGVSRPRRAVVVGGGLLGLQVARALGARGLDTEIVEGADHLLHQQLGRAAGRILARDLKKLGVAVYTGARAVRLEDAGGRVNLRLDNGFTLDTDLVVLTAGGRPSTALARQAGLEVRRGVVVDDRLASVTDERVFAIGDCAEHEGRVTGFVPPAWEQASVLAGVLSDEPMKYDGSRIVARLRATGLDVAVLGDPERETLDGGDVVEMSNPVRGSHRKLVVRDGRIVAGAFVGDLHRIGLVTQHYDRQTVLGPTEPGDLLLVERSAQPVQLPDDAEVCNCAGVTAGAIRAYSSYEQARETTRATTGCGGCASTVRQLLAERSALEGIK